MDGVSPSCEPADSEWHMEVEMDRQDETRDIPSTDDEDVDGRVFPGPAAHPPTEQARPDAEDVERELSDEEGRRVLPEAPSVI